VLASESEPLQALVAILSGREAPSSGRVRLGDSAPSATPQTRRSIAALFADEALPPASNVESSVALALETRGDTPKRATELLTAAGLDELRGLRPGSLDQRATRSVALALALAHEQAALLALHEPLSTSLDAAWVLRELDRHTARGAIVLATTTSSADALLLGGSWLSLELGRVRSDAATTPRLGAGPFQRVVVEADDANALARLLQASPLQLTLIASAPRSLEIIGPALDITVHEVVALSREHGIELRRVTATVAPVEVLMAARAGFARGAYEAARAAAAPGGYR
jgi:ABC-type sulfate/molybdate transport systems ATPase subunit